MKKISKINFFYESGCTYLRNLSVQMSFQRQVCSKASCCICHTCKCEHCAIALSCPLSWGSEYFEQIARDHPWMNWEVQQRGSYYELVSKSYGGMSQHQILNCQMHGINPQWVVNIVDMVLASDKGKQQ